jgi:hypothetical protein
MTTSKSASYPSKTTELTVLRKFPSAFTWGRIVAFHDLGPYTIAGFHPISYTGESKTKHLDVTEYHVWVDGKDTCTGAKSLEEAILLGIGIRNLGANSGPHMARAAFKILQ